MTALAVTTLTGAAACGSATTSGTAVASTTTALATTSASAGTDTSAAAGADKPGAATPAALMTDFVTDVLEQHYYKACLLNAPSPGMNVDPATVCQQAQAVKALTSLHDAWAKPGVTLPPTSKVTVSPITPKNDTATVTDSQITVDGHTLNALMLIGSTNAGGFAVTWDLVRQQGRWLISTMNLGN